MYHSLPDRSPRGRIIAITLSMISWVVLIHVAASVFFRADALASGHLIEILPPTPIVGIAKNLSGLTWNDSTQTFFAVTNSPECAFELTSDGQVLRSIALHGFKDVEDIVHIEGTLFAIVEERKGRLHVLNIPDTATEVTRDDAQSLKLGNKGHTNKGLESVGYDRASRTLFTMREGKPYVRIDIPYDGKIISGRVSKKPLPMLRVKDVAAIACDPDGTMWILSEDSSAIVNIDLDGQELRRFKLRINTTTFQPEGLARTPDGRLYVAGEPNMLAIYSIAP